MNRSNFNKITNKYTYFDTHAHLNISPLLENIDEIIKDCIKNKVIVNIVGTNYENSVIAINLAKKYDNCLCSIGIHPCDSKECDDFVKIEKLLLDNKEYVFAIGECGLDYYHKPYDENQQKQLFLKHIELAKKNNLPLIVHVRNAFDDLLSILANCEISNMKVLIHCFDGDLEYVKKLSKYDCYFAIGGKTTYNGSEYLLNAINYIKQDRLLAETDCPFLCPFDKKQTNVPQNVIKIIEFLKSNKNQIYKNSINFFK